MDPLIDTFDCPNEGDSNITFSINQQTLNIEKSSVGSMTSPKTASGSLFKNFSKGENLQKISSQKEPETSFNFHPNNFAFSNKECQFLPKKKNRNKKRNKALQFQEEDVENLNSSKALFSEEQNTLLINAEKPMLIKTLSFDKNEYEIALEAFLNREYNPEVQKEISTLVKTNIMNGVEYKLKLVNPSPERIIHLTNQMKFRLQEGNGEIKYEIGITDEGTPIGLAREEMLQSLSNFFL